MAKDDVDWDTITRSNYRTTFGFPSNWIRKANHLLFAAEQLEDAVHQNWSDMLRWAAAKGKLRGPSEDPSPTYFMLVAYAVENLFKARLTIKNRWQYEQYIRAKGEIPPDLRSHDLVKLATKVGWEQSHQDEDLLQRLTRCSVWAGRYPIPTKWAEYRTAKRFADGKDYSVAYFAAGDAGRIRDLVARIRRDLDV